MRVYIFGGSTAQGYYDTQGGWATRIAVHYQQEALKHLDDETIVRDEVFNLGVAGDTTEGVLGRIKAEVEARRLIEDDECIILAVGMNDTILIENRVVTEVNDFQERYEALIDEALKLCPRVICIGLTAVRESEADPWAYSSRGKQWKNNRIKLFEDTIKQSALRKEVAFVPIHEAFQKLNSEMNLISDGLHPNDAGHAFMTREIMPAIEALR